VCGCCTLEQVACRTYQRLVSGNRLLMVGCYQSSVGDRPSTVLVMRGLRLRCQQVRIPAIRSRKSAVRSNNKPFSIHHSRSVFNSHPSQPTVISQLITIKRLAARSFRANKQPSEPEASIWQPALILSS
jgi:hypothetical protein